MNKNQMAANRLFPANIFRGAFTALLCGAALTGLCADYQPEWRDPVEIKHSETAVELLPADAADTPKAQEKPRDPGWIGSCYYYADGSYYHEKGIYWLADETTHYEFSTRRWVLRNQGVIDSDGRYRPPIADIGGIAGWMLRMAAASTAVITGPPTVPAPREAPAKPGNN